LGTGGIFEGIGMGRAETLLACVADAIVLFVFSGPRYSKSSLMAA
jgi:hypothetical protein